MNVRVIIISDIRLYREGLASALNNKNSLIMCGVYDFNQDLTQLFSSHPADVVLIDTSDSKTSINTIKYIAAYNSECAILALALKETEEHVIAFFDAGCSSYVPRDASLDDLVQVILRTHSGELVCSPKMAGSLLRHLKRNLRAKIVPDTHRVTNRELQVVKLIDGGLSNKEIAHQLSIEVSTVKNHVHSILEKLDVNRRNQAAARLRHLF